MAKLNERFASSSFFGQIYLQSGYYEKLRVQPLRFSLLLLSFSPLFPFLLSFFFVTVILELLGVKKPAF